MQHMFLEDVFEAISQHGPYFLGVGLGVKLGDNGGGGGGFFLACKDFWRMFDNSVPACAFFLKWRLAHAN